MENVVNFKGGKILQQEPEPVTVDEERKISSEALKNEVEKLVAELLDGTVDTVVLIKHKLNGKKGGGSTNSAVFGDYQPLTIIGLLEITKAAELDMVLCGSDEDDDNDGSEPAQ